MRRTVTTVAGWALTVALWLAAPALAAPAAAPAAAAKPAVTPAAATPPAVLTPPPPAPPTPASPPPPTPDQRLDADAERLASIANDAQTISSEARLQALEVAAGGVEADARTIEAPADARIAALDKRVAAIIPRWRRVPTASEAARAAPLVAQANAVRPLAQHGRQVVTEAEETYSLVAQRLREGFSARVLTRSASPLEPGFWAQLIGASGDDGARLAAMADDAGLTAGEAPEPRGALRLFLGLAVGAAILFAAWWVRRPPRRLIRPGRAPIARSGAALWTAVVGAAAPTLAAAVLRLSAEWGGLLSRQADAMAGAAVGATAWAAGILALGRALGTDRDRGCRLLDVGDDTAHRMRPPLLVVAAVTAAGSLFNRLIYVIGASVSATIAVDCLLAVAYSAVAGLIVVSFGRGRRSREEGGGDRSAAQRSGLWTLASLALSGAIAVTLGAVALGYSTLASLVSGQIFWVSIIVAGAWLLMRFADDLATALFSDRGWATRALRTLFGLKRSAIGQTGALLSGAAQVAVIIAALALALTPFGQGASLLATHLAAMAGPIKLGTATFAPSAILTGLATLVIGIALARVVQGWVEKRYLPVTDWDAGVRNSVSTGIGYVGVIVAVLWALASAGVGLAQLALVASALSVGIGFGLQQVVQNFVAGLIILVERPVKVGDWVNVGGVEGDIRRIRVRATEIETFDRTTAIVPNSNLITMSVQNKTVGGSGRVDLHLSVTDAAEAEKARGLIIEALKGRPNVSATRPAAVLLDGLAASGAANLVAYVYIDDPRKGGQVRSDAYLQVIEALKQAGVAFTGVSAA